MKRNVQMTLILNYEANSDDYGLIDCEDEADFLQEVKAYDTLPQELLETVDNALANEKCEVTSVIFTDGL